MLLSVFSVRDITSDEFGRPFYDINAGSAIRSFTDMVNKNDEQNVLFQHPKDFELYECGTFDTRLGIFDLLPKPKQLITAAACVRKAS